MAAKLTDENIFECLKSLSVPLRKQDITNPKQEFMIRVFECFLKDLQIEVTSQTLRPWNATQHIKEPEIYEDCINLTLMVISINHIFHPTGMKITMRDIIEPRPKRTKKILNYLILLWNSYLNRYAVFRTTEVELEQEGKQIDSLILHIEEMDEKHLEYSSILENMQPCADELKSCNAVKKEKIKTFEEKQTNMQNHNSNLKTEQVELQNKISATSVDIVSAKEKLDELRQLILSSPDRLKSEVQKLREDIKSVELKIKNKGKELKDLKKNLEDGKKAQGNYSKHLTSLQKINEELQHLRKQIQDFLSDMQNIPEKEESVRKLEADIGRLSEKIPIMEQKCAKEKLSVKKHLQSLNGMIEEVERELQQENKLLVSSKENEQTLCKSIEAEGEALLQMKEKHKRSVCEVDQNISIYKKKMQNLQAEFSTDAAQIAERLKKMM